MRSVSKEFFYQIIKSKKKIIIYSPLSSGENLTEATKISNDDTLKSILKFFKSLSISIEYIVFGTKKIERIKFIENNFKQKIIF